MSLRAFLIAAALAVSAGQAGAQSDPASAAWLAIEDLEAAAVELRTAERARDRVAALTQVVRAYEAGLEAMREGLRRVNIREAAIRGVFEAERERLSRLLGVLQSIKATPAPITLMHPDGPLGAARSGMILSDIVPALQKQTESLRHSLEEVAVLRALQESAVGVLQEGLAGVQDARTALSQAVSDRVELPRRFLADEEAMLALVNSTETLEGFASGLMAVDILPGNAPEMPPHPFASRRGALDLPVLGRVLRRYNEADAAGIRRPGLILATRPLSLVSTPAPATIRYAGPLLDYGNVAILEPESGYLIIFAGMGQVFGKVGEVLPEGAPIGLMGGQSPQAQAVLIQTRQGSTTDHSETLYIELRENGIPVDPSDWFAVNKE